MGNIMSHRYKKLDKKCFYCRRYLPQELIAENDTSISTHYNTCKLCYNTKKKLIKNYVSKYRKYPSLDELNFIESNLIDILKDFSKNDLDKIDYDKIV